MAVMGVFKGELGQRSCAYARGHRSKASLVVELANWLVGLCLAPHRLALPGQ